MGRYENMNFNFFHALYSIVTEFQTEFFHSISAFFFLSLTVVLWFFAFSSADSPLLFSSTPPPPLSDYRSHKSTISRIYHHLLISPPPPRLASSPCLPKPGVPSVVPFSEDESLLGGEVGCFRTIVGLKFNYESMPVPYVKRLCLLKTALRKVKD